MHIEPYLQRLGLQGPLRPDLASLAALQLAHLRQVPFENLSIHRGDAIVLDEAWLYRKIVEQRRGGFCYELNGLFAWLLRGLGFQVRLLAAEVAVRGGGYGPPFDHMALLVQLDGQDWLVDVGFGDSFQQPLRLLERAAQPQGDRAYRLDCADGQYTLLRTLPDAATEYRFRAEAHELAEFEPMCRYHQTSPASHFTQKRICSRATPEGRVSLSGLRLIVTRQGRREEQPLDSEAAFDAALAQHFGVQW